MTIILKKHITFGKWLKGFITIRITPNSRRSFNIMPKWLLLGILGASYAVQYIGTESGVLVFLEFVMIFLIGGLLWYGFDRLRGKTRIVEQE